MRACLSICVVFALVGCVTVYQPLTGLHRPVALDLRAPNLRGLELTVRCLAGPDLDREDAGALCGRLTRLFEHQGAKVRVATDLRARRGEEDDEDDEDDGRQAPKPEVAPSSRSGLELVLRSRVVHRQTTNFLLFDYTSEFTVAVDVVLRDPRGALLVRDTLRGRFMEELGFSTDTPEVFSADFYGQLSQMTFNAQVRARVLAEGP